jgi:hypothetical protein
MADRSRNMQTRGGRTDVNHDRLSLSRSIALKASDALATVVIGTDKIVMPSAAAAVLTQRSKIV